MRRWRTVIAGVIAVALGAGLAVSGVTSATAATTGNWATVTVDGTSRAYTGSIALPGFPDTTFTSTSRQATVVSGASTWQGASTPPGTVYGTSRGATYLNQRPAADDARSPAVTTWTFDGGTPGAGGWSFVLGDVDADQATISATLADGTPATVDQLGYAGSYNSCSTVSPGGWSCPRDPGGVAAGQDLPSWDPATGVLRGNDAANDTAGASAWFTPTASLATLTIAYQQRSGLPVYQTWFANRTSSLAGTAALDGEPLVDTLVTVTAPNGTEYTTTTGADGAYAFPALTQADGYRVSIATPDNAAVDRAPAVVDLRTDVTDADFVLSTVPGTVDLDGSVIDADGRPVADAEVTVTDTSGLPLATVVTDADGRWRAVGLPAGTAVVATVSGAPPVSGSTGADGAPVAALDPIVLPISVGTITGRVTLDGGAPAAPALVEVLQGGGVVATVETDADGTYGLALRPGTYTVRTEAAVAGAPEPTELTVEVTADGTVRADFPFTTPAAVTVGQAGSVRYEDGTPVVDTTVTARPVEAGSGAVVTVETTADGGYSLAGLTPSTEYAVSVEGAPVRTVTTPATGTAADAVDFVLPLPTVDQPGTVSDADGAPTAAVLVVATPTGDDDGEPVSTTTGDDGTFVLEGLRPLTEYTITAGTGSEQSDPVVVTTAAVGGTPEPVRLVLAEIAVTPEPTPTVTPQPTDGPTPSAAPVAGGTGTGNGGGPTGGGLAFTGADVTPAVAVAALLLLTGGGLLSVRAARRRRSVPQD